MENQTKLKALLEHFLTGNSKIASDHLNNLLIHLWWEDKAENKPTLQIYSNWIIKAVSVYCTRDITLNSDLASFVLNLSAFLLENEERFTTFNKNDFFSKLLRVTKARNSEDELVRFNYVQVLAGLLEHKSGIECIMTFKHWEDVLEFYLKTANAVTAEEYRKFFLKFFQNVENCEEVVAKILNSCVFDENEHLLLVLKLVVNVLEEFFEKSLDDGKKLKVVYCFVKKFAFSDFSVLSEKRNLFYYFSKISFIMQFVDLYGKVLTKKITGAKINSTIKKLQNDFILILSKEDFLDEIDFCKFSFLFWKVLETKIPISQRYASFGQQLVSLLMMPHCNLLFDYNYLILMKQKNEEDVVFGSMVDDIMAQMSYEVTRLMFFWQNTLKNHPHLLKISIKSLKTLAESSSRFSRQGMVYLFQTFVYFLKPVVLVYEETQSISLFLDKSFYYHKLFRFLGFLIEEYQITLKDAIEVTYVMTICVDFLSMGEWPLKMILEVLKVLKIAVDHHMTTNMALLVENIQDSTLIYLGPLICSKLMSGEDLIKVGTLNVVHSVAVVSKRVEATLITVPVFVEWLENATTMWSTTGLRPNPTVVPFLLNLSRFLAQNEEHFYRLTKSSVFIKLISILDLRQTRSNILKLEYVNLLSKFLEHEAGLNWLKTYEFWEDVHNFGVTSKNSEVFEESAKFLALFLRRAINDQEFCDKIIKKIVSAENSTHIKVNDKILKKFKFIFRILEFSLEICYEDENFDVLSIFFINLQTVMDFDFLEVDVFDFEDYRCRKGIYILKFLELVDRVSRNSDSVFENIKKIKTTYVIDFGKREYQDVVEYLNFTIVYFSLINRRILNTHTAQCIFQSIVLLLIPFYSILQSFPIESSKDFFDEYRTDLIDDMVRKLNPALIRCSYKWRDKLAKNDCFRTAIKSLKILKEQRNFFTRNDAVLIFQTCIYCLKDFNRIIKIVPEKIHLFYTHTDFFFETFNLLNILLNDFEITWNDIYEIIYLMPLALDFATLANCPKDLTFLVLEVVRATIEKSDAPNLTLVFDSTRNLFGPLVHCNLFHESTEMRKVSLRIVYTVAHATRCKFPSLQKVLMDSELPTLVVKMSACDGESFVRATAIKCLQEMIQVEEIWNNALKSEDLPQKMRDVLLNEPEGIVRVEAATFMCVAYEHQQFPKDSLERVYETMIYSSTVDLHWEVKVRALGFWDKVIKSHLQNQGMIDDSFPNVTFSKEHRKIVTLTDSEIRKRLLKVLGQLSEIGCLGVLTCAIRDDCDMEVSKTAVKIAQRLVDLFEKYKMTGEGSAPTSPAPTENGRSTVSVSSGVSVDDAMDSPQVHHELNEEVIEQIVNAKDVSLLKGVYSTSDYGSVSNYDIQVKKIVTPNEFLQFTQQDLNAIIAEKKKWLNGIEDLGSLLDDMLKTYDDEVNNMDCY